MTGLEDTIIGWGWGAVVAAIAAIVISALWQMLGVNVDPRRMSTPRPGGARQLAMRRYWTTRGSGLEAKSTASQRSAVDAHDTAVIAAVKPVADTVLVWHEQVDAANRLLPHPESQAGGWADGAIRRPTPTTVTVCCPDADSRLHGRRIAQHRRVPQLANTWSTSGRHRVERRAV